MNVNAPWLSSYGDVPHNLDYPDGSIVKQVFIAGEKLPDVAAYDFFGCKKSYRDFMEDVRLCARGLLAIGLKQGDRFTICMPNSPQAVTMLYALNLIGAVASMVHPLSAEEELIRFISDSESVAVLTLDQFSSKLVDLLPRTKARKLVLTGADDSLYGITKLGYKLTKGRKIPKLPTGGNILRYTDLLLKGESYNEPYDAGVNADDVAAILYSGGTSGTSKGVLLTNRNINALAMQTVAAGDCVEADKTMVAIIPLFHGFGLGVCIHTTLISSATILLVPQFSLKAYAKLLEKRRPHYIAGVPTLFEALLRLKGIDNLDMSQMKGIFSGGDSLSIELKRKVDAFLKKHGSKEQVREGYGLTECVSASCLTPRKFHKEGSIGIPYPDMFYKIVRPGTIEALPYGEEGEIVISGPTVMKGYNNNPDETAKALQTHDDGRVWLHTGDLGYMDEEGFVYFRQRIKRMIVTGGYNVYPTQLENAIEAHEKVLISCVIGLPDTFKGQRIKAFIVLRDGEKPTEAVKTSILEHCKKNISKYAIPSEIEYRDELPKTLVGKVAYLKLEEEEQLKAAG
ncbi:MAG: AMP-binding protein [Oscillospiraceae bacterium]|nr:AMP-binding protein [Oscillospiraceae bacterium]MCL2278224.1 AMP-binding protein [Oscillospiraceae bacterium]